MNYPVSWILPAWPLSEFYPSPSPNLSHLPDFLGNSLIQIRKRMHPAESIILITPLFQLSIIIKKMFEIINKDNEFQNKL